MANRVKIMIYNSEYSILTDEDPDYVKDLAFTIDDALSGIMSSDTSTSIVQALVLCSLSYLDSATKEEKNADNLRIQVQRYVEESAKAGTEINELQRDIAMLRKENQQLKSQLLESSMPDNFKSN